MQSSQNSSNVQNVYLTRANNEKAKPDNKYIKIGIRTHAIVARNRYEMQTHLVTQKISHPPENEGEDTTTPLSRDTNNIHA